MWTIPVQECQTWFTFVSHFRHYQPLQLQFFQRFRVVRPSHWPQLYRLAVRNEKKIVLDVYVKPRPTLPQPEVLAPLPDTSRSPVPSSHGGQNLLAPGSPQSTQTQQKKRRPSISKTEPSYSGVLAYLGGFTNTVSPTAPPRFFENETIKQYFADLENQMFTKTIFKDRRLYKFVEVADRSAVHDAMDTERRNLELSEPSEDHQRDFDQRVKVFNAADSIFRFFFSPDASVATTGRYWGAVLALVNQPPTGPPDFGPAQSGSRPSGKQVFGVNRRRWATELDMLTSALDDIRSDVLSFGETFANIQESDRARIEAPPVLADAWVHITLALVVFPSDSRRGIALAQRAKSDIWDGIKEIMACGSEPATIKHLAVLPCDLVALMAMKLTNNATANMPSVSDTYGSYLNMIESEVTTGHPDRRNDQKLNLFLQELSIIDWTVDIQISILEGLVRRGESVARNVGAKLAQAETQLNRHHRDREPGQMHLFPYRRIGPPEYDNMTSMADQIFQPNERGDRGPTGFSSVLLQECLRDLSLKKSDLEMMRDTANILKRTNETNLSRTKDRQERAIYAFTIVTIIFLPLSAVSSIFGMNTADIRDMDIGQWVYWATAVPVTAVVMFLGLWFTGELGNFRRWVAARGVEWWGTGKGPGMGPGLDGELDEGLESSRKRGVKGSGALDTGLSSYDG
ncbi:uncharacterized protein C8A04DRAFT_24189 [Dichotomopilus funicola]|uniref:Uncharacterized protein n=1 Tax=Dichotomopilus funicola TaxID=1934379 RepID=A0AAN6VAC6_9PEZI|nr:hypothetical protein C8A04DRAFT_24189 [Dichotomopilus funicola]